MPVPRPWLALAVRFGNPCLSLSIWPFTPITAARGARVRGTKERTEGRQIKQVRIAHVIEHGLLLLPVERFHRRQYLLAW